MSLDLIGFEEFFKKERNGAIEPIVRFHHTENNLSKVSRTPWAHCYAFILKRMHEVH